MQNEKAESTFTPPTITITMSRDGLLHGVANGPVQSLIYMLEEMKRRIFETADKASLRPAGTVFHNS